MFQEADFPPKFQMLHALAACVSKNYSKIKAALCTISYVFGSYILSHSFVVQVCGLQQGISETSCSAAQRASGTL